MDHMITIDPFMADLKRLYARVLSACCQHYDSVPAFFWGDVRGEMLRNE